ncbi:hypothetical protein HPB50_006639 [Hyalomma asiaticum]|uniref:Uncharacterized protein n=1 Tax=Hyalomma asiaticum TaxID=266040 RepID=A0ACB7SVU1_HYAAI|nr:hypothetical protein HPB50_006639 [Hyalomma asiaticum]
MPPEIRSYVTQNEMKGWLQAKDLAELAANFDESMLQSTSYSEATAKERPHIQQGRQNYARDLRPDRMRCFSCRQPGHLRRECEGRYGRDPRKPEVFRIAALNEQPREISSLAWRSEKPLTNSVSTGDNQVQIFVGEGVCTARIDSGADITVIRAGKVPKEFRGRSGDRMKLTGPFGNTITADVMYLPLGLPCPSGNTQLVSLLCAVTPELATSADVLLTPRDYASLCLGKSRSERNLDGRVCSLVERAAEQEVILTSRNGLDTATTFCDDNKARNAIGEEPNKGGEDDVCCEATLQPSHASEDSGDNKISEQEADPASDYGEQAGVAKVVTAGHPAHVGSSGEKERLIPLTASAFSKKRMHDELSAEARHVFDAVTQTAPFLCSRKGIGGSLCRGREGNERPVAVCSRGQAPALEKRVCENALVKSSEDFLRAESMAKCYLQRGKDDVFIDVPFKSA